ncbi:MAG TPA: carbohydrate kinase family protein [Kofleriaceae bacterium]|jgi:sugar/nucleoside kinase (ribokinase family)|nr:carbohydrate kinase family protein [Kofleriaceae bacterium]
MDDQLDAVVVGGAGVDTNVYLAGEDVDWSVETNFTRNVDCVGQAGGYASRLFARLGKRTAYIGPVGDDHNGRLVRDTLARDGIDLGGLFVDAGGTNRSVNVMYRDGRRKNFYDGRGSLTLQPDLALCRRVLARTRLAQFSIVHWARQLLPVARELGVTIAVDLQDVVTADDPYRQDFVDGADIVLFSGVNHPDPEPLIAAYRRRNPRAICVVGMGPRGAVLGTADGVRWFGPVAHEQPVVDTNGAGDSLAAGFLASYLLDGFAPGDAVQRGQLLARHTCTLAAGDDGFLTRRELDERFAALRA